MRLLALLLTSSALCLPPLAAQQSVGYGQTAVLPSNGNAGSDHATLAANSYGDAFVAWHSAFNGGFHLVEGSLITTDGQGSFTSSQANHFVLGDPTLGLLGEDSCTKPDVIAMPDDSFIIAWQRFERNGLGFARIETCRITCRDSAGLLLPTPVIDAPLAGEGFVIDDTIIGGDAGVMVDLVALSDNSVAAAYVHQANRVEDPLSGNVYRDYDIRMTRIDWQAGPTSPSFTSSPTVVVPNVPLDSTPLHPFIGGQVLPDLVVDDLGDLVLAYEQYRLDGHGGVPSGNEGHIAVRRFIGYGKPNELTQTNADFFTNFINRHQRRPNLATSRKDLNNSVSLTWMEDEVTFWRSNAIFAKELDYGPGTGPPNLRDLYWPNEASREDVLPTVVHGTEALRYVLGIREFSSGDRLLIARTKEQDIREIPTLPHWPWRPAADLVEKLTPLGTTNRLLFLCYEGSDTRYPGSYRIYFQVHLLP